MKQSIHFKIILLLLIFITPNLQAVQSTLVDKTAYSASTSVKKTVKDNPKMSKRKSRLFNKIKKRFTSALSKKSKQKNNLQNEELETVTHGLSIASMALGLAALLTILITIILDSPGILVVAILFAIAAI